MGAFESKLITPARWDKFLSGDQNSLSPKEKRGFIAFNEAGCNACHTGTLLGGGTYQKLGAMKPWPNQKDQGRYEVTKKDSDKMIFKVPSLRNITETAPYFHDGSVASLVEAIQMMGEYQLGKTISEKDAKDIAAWMGTLKGEVPEDYIREPSLPPSGPNTPAADPS